MNPFVNLKKRSVELPKGCKDLADVLKKNRHPTSGLRNLAKPTSNPTCDYCGGRPVGGLCMLGDEAHFWCEQCRQDLTEFYAQSSIALPDVIDSEDQELVTGVSLQIEAVEREKERFLRRKVAERKGAA